MAPVRQWPLLLAAAVAAPRVAAFTIAIDLNTYNDRELQYAANHFRADGTWTNSPNVSDPLWAQAIAQIGGQGDVFSEDLAGSAVGCSEVRSLAGGRLTAAFEYHETGGEPKTMLTNAEVEQTVQLCKGARVIVLTRAYWPGSQWRTGVEAVLPNCQLYGAAMEFNPHDYGKRSEDEFVKGLLAAGKRPMFLLPFVFNDKPTERNIKDFLAWLSGKGIDISDPRIYMVLARYDLPHIPIAGATNSIASALAAAKAVQAQLAANHSLWATEQATIMA